MKTTLDLSDDLLTRARRHAKKKGQTLTSLVEEGLRLALEAKPAGRYALPDRSVGKAGDPNPLEGLSWRDLLDEIYGGR